LQKSSDLQKTLNVNQMELRPIYRKNNIFFLWITAAAMILKTELSRDSVVPRFTQEKTSNLFVVIIRFSYLSIPNVRGISTSAWSHQSLPGQQCTRSKTRRTLSKQLWRKCPTKKPYSRSIIGATLY